MADCVVDGRPELGESVRDGQLGGQWKPELGESIRDGQLGGRWEAEAW